MKVGRLLGRFCSHKQQDSSIDDQFREVRRAEIDKSRAIIKDLVGGAIALKPTTTGGGAGRARKGGLPGTSEAVSRSQNNCGGGDPD